LPPLFVLAAQWVGQRLGPPELAWRLVPALCGVLVVPFTYLVARTLHAPRSLALVAASMCASSLSLVIWSRELKHYNIEALVSVLAALLVFQARRSASRSKRWALGACVTALGLVAPWVAYGTIIPLAALLPLLLVCRPAVGSRRGTFLIGLAGLVALGIGGCTVWQVAARGQAAHAELVHYTSRWFIKPADLDSWRPPLGSHAWATAGLFCPPGWFHRVEGQHATVMLAPIVAAIWIIAFLGLWTWPRRGRLELLWWLLIPWLMTLGASLAQRYPFGQARMMQFWVPPMVLAVTAGLVMLWRALVIAVTGRGAPALVSALLISVFPASIVLQHARTHCHHYYHDFPTILRTLHAQRLRGEPVLVELYATPCVQYYAPTLPPPAVVTPLAVGTLPPETLDWQALIEPTLRQGTGRIWILAVDDSPVLTDGSTRSTLRRAGYSVSLVQRAGGTAGFGGAAQLLVATRR
jgi:hypothetical protein